MAPSRPGRGFFDAAVWALGPLLAVTALGARFFLRFKGSWYPGPIIDNTQIYAALREALGLDK